MNTKGSHWRVAYSANPHGTNLINWIGGLKVWDDIHGKEQNQNLVVKFWRRRSVSGTLKFAKCHQAHKPDVIRATMCYTLATTVRGSPNHVPRGYHILSGSDQIRLFPLVLVETADYNRYPSHGRTARYYNEPSWDNIGYSVYTHAITSNQPEYM